MKLKSIFLLSVPIIVVFALYLFCVSRRKFAEKIFPKITQYTLIQPIGVNSESDERIVYYINDSYVYDSLDVAILKDIFQNRLIDYTITKKNEILVPSRDINVEIMFFIENMRLEKKNKISN